LCAAEPEALRVIDDVADERVEEEGGRTGGACAPARTDAEVPAFPSVSASVAGKRRARGFAGMDGPVPRKGPQNRLYPASELYPLPARPTRARRAAQGTVPSAPHSFARARSGGGVGKELRGPGEPPGSAGARGDPPHRVCFPRASRRRAREVVGPGSVRGIGPAVGHAEIPRAV
jgi:hypothetical protein